jgi:hypothetical protein
MPVSQAYLNRIISHYLRVGVERQQPPAAAVLRIAEATVAQWQPAEMGWQKMVEELLVSVPQKILAPTMITAIISASGRWGLDGPWAVSWFEDNQEVADLAMSMDGQPRDAVRDALLNGIIEKHRSIWAERFALTALWMKEASAGPLLCCLEESPARRRSNRRKTQSESMTGAESGSSEAGISKIGQNLIAVLAKRETALTRR